MNINWHSIRMYSLIVVMFIIGGLTALKGSIPGDMTTIISVLVLIEHFLDGNTTPTV